jgi:hypothetical protein
MIIQDGSLNLGPLSDEISEHLGLYRLPTQETYGVCAKFYHPFNDVAIGLLVSKNVAKRVFGDYGDGICLEVVAEFPRRNQDGV